MFHRTRFPVSALLIVVAIGAAAFAQQVPADAINIKGRVVAWNRGGNGSVEGLLLNGDRGLVQVNFPPDMSGAITKTVAPGDTVEVTVTTAPEGPRGRGRGGPRGDGGPAAGRASAKPDHPVYELVLLTDARGKQYAREGPGHGRVTVDGILQSFNYNREGIIDGLQLANGDLVHLGPAGLGINLSPGQRIVVEGTVRNLADGTHLIDPVSINGVEVKKPAPPDGGRGRGAGRGAATPDDAGPRAAATPPTPPGDDAGPPPAPDDDAGPPPPPDDGGPDGNMGAPDPADQ
jgi:hypothetical protein